MPLRHLLAFCPTPALRVALCHFPDCSHTHEEGCAVKQAAAVDLIHASRYASYKRIFTGEDLD